jgi:hypothetical protein
VAHTSGPAGATPVRIAGHQPPTGAPDETALQPNAHIGANQVSGLQEFEDRAGDWTGPAAEREDRVFQDRTPRLTVEPVVRN